MIRAAALALALLLAGCANTTENMRKQATTIAAAAGMHPVSLTGGAFNLLAFERMGSPTAPVHLYIEGDGNAWLAGNMVSPDPTPLDPITLKIAIADPSPNVVYMGRICQYVTSPSCNPRFWTSHQFSEDTISAYTQALTRWQSNKLELTGFSGGAGVVLLIAPRLPNVIALRTIAGNIDTDAFTAIHHISPLSNSLNPTSTMRTTARIPQRHFAGANDTTVPPSIIQSYQSRLPEGNCSAINIVPGLDHYGNWASAWPALLATPLPCAKETIN